MSDPNRLSDDSLVEFNRDNPLEVNEKYLTMDGHEIRVQVTSTYRDEDGQEQRRVQTLGPFRTLLLSHATDKEEGHVGIGTLLVGDPLDYHDVYVASLVDQLNGDRSVISKALAAIFLSRHAPHLAMAISESYMQVGLEKALHRWEAQYGGAPGEKPAEACVICGCTDLNCQECIEETGFPCSWAATTSKGRICSRCFDSMEAIDHG